MKRVVLSIFAAVLWLQGCTNEELANAISTVTETEQEVTDSETVIEIVAGEETTSISEVSDNLEEAKLIHVLDGDTLYVDIGGTGEKVRMIGLDTPESVHEDVTRNTQEGIDASEFTKYMLKDVETVYLEYDAEARDKYERLLAYVWFDNGSELVMANRVILRAGMARTLTIPPNVKYADLFTEDEAGAREKQMGFWSENELFTN